MAILYGEDSQESKPLVSFRVCIHVWFMFKPVWFAVSKVNPDFLIVGSGRPSVFSHALLED